MVDQFDSHVNDWRGHNARLRRALPAILSIEDASACLRMVVSFVMREAYTAGRTQGKHDTHAEISRRVDEAKKNAATAVLRTLQES